MRAIFLVVAAVMPWAVRKWMLQKLCRAEFGNGAFVGMSYIDVSKLIMCDGAKIGKFNCFRQVRNVSLGKEASIGNLNWFTGASVESPPMQRCFEKGSYCSGALSLKDGAAITARHYIDIHADVDIGMMSIVAGVRSTILTHSIDFVSSRQRANGVVIGDYVFVGSNCIILPGAKVAGRCIVGAGSLVRGYLDQEWCSYGGQPARRLKSLDRSALFFHRKQAFVRW